MHRSILGFSIRRNESIQPSLIIWVGGGAGVGGGGGFPLMGAEEKPTALSSKQELKNTLAQKMAAHKNPDDIENFGPQSHEPGIYLN